MTNEQSASIRGSNFTSAEYEAIARAWMRASEDPISGAEQKGSVFHKRIHDLYNDVFKPASKDCRPLSSIVSKSKYLHKECFRFQSCYMKVCRMQISGTSSDDNLRLATALYNNREVSRPTEDCGPSFKFRSAWEVFRKHEKFLCAIENKGEKKPIIAGSTVVAKEEGDCNGKEAGQADENKVASRKKGERPIGRRKAKEQYFKQRQQEDKIKVAEALVETQKERNRTLKRQLAMQLFQDTSNGCSKEESAEFFTLLREEALNELRNERSKRQRAESSERAEKHTAGSSEGSPETATIGSEASRNSSGAVLIESQAEKS